MDVGFYLRRISRGGMMDYPAIPENLWSKILQDGLTLTGQTDNNSLGEFDYTQGSGWMYSVGGNTYAGKGLSGYYLTDGDTLYLRFTLPTARTSADTAPPAAATVCCPAIAVSGSTAPTLRSTSGVSRHRQWRRTAPIPARSAPSAPSAAIGRISRRCRLWGMISWRRDARSRERTEHRLHRIHLLPLRGAEAGADPGGQCRVAFPAAQTAGLCYDRSKI